MSDTPNNPSPSSFFDEPEHLVTHPTQQGFTPPPYLPTTVPIATTHDRDYFFHHGTNTPTLLPNGSPTIMSPSDPIVPHARNQLPERSSAFQRSGWNPMGGTYDYGAIGERRPRPAHTKIPTPFPARLTPTSSRPRLSWGGVSRERLSLSRQQMFGVSGHNACETFVAAMSPPPQHLTTSSRTAQAEHESSPASSRTHSKVHTPAVTGLGLSGIWVNDEARSHSSKDRVCQSP